MQQSTTTRTKRLPRTLSIRVSASLAAAIERERERLEATADGSTVTLSEAARRMIARALGADR